MATFKFQVEVTSGTVFLSLFVFLFICARSKSRHAGYSVRPGGSLLRPKGSFSCGSRDL